MCSCATNSQSQIKTSAEQDPVGLKVLTNTFQNKIFFNSDSMTKQIDKTRTNYLEYLNPQNLTNIASPADVNHQLK